jgi:TM2 domain-containing membrane protein YozV
MLAALLNRPKSRFGAVALALLSALLPWPVAGLHKFYLGQPLWGAIYLLLWQTPMPRVACAIDAVWYLVQGEESFNQQYNALPPPQAVASLADNLRELEKLRAEGLMSDYEFEQKRRQLLERPV